MTSTSSFIKATVAAFIVSALGDFLWHDVLMLSFYGSRLMNINGVDVMQTMTVPVSIIVIEIILALGTAYFVLKVAHNYAQAFWNGLLLGLMTVGTLNFVNHSLILHWDTTLVAVDTLWGVVLGGIGGLAVFWAGKKA